jgi:5'(3')-deoxyribonucleotidase
MKYFIEATRPRAMYTLGPLANFKFAKHTMYEVTSDKAYDLYLEAADHDHLFYDKVSWAWETGERVYVDENSVVICGLDISDEDVFKMKLEGKVGSGIFK